MEKREFAQFVMAMRTFYSKENLLPNDYARELWFNQLKDIPYNVAEAVLNKWVSTNKWSPSIADIREQAAIIVNGDMPDWGKGWEITCKSIRRYGSYRESDALECMDDITRATVLRLGYRNLCMSEEINQDRANFRMIFQQIAERKKSESQIPADLIIMIENIREHNKKEIEQSESKRISSSGEKA